MKNINKNQTFYIDFDGVILDTMPIYRYIRAKYNLKGDDSTLFRYLNVSDVINRKRAINNSLEILKKVQDELDIRILSKVNNDYEARIKKEFLTSCGITIPFIGVPQYERKSNYADNMNKDSVLFDDLKDNVDEWESAGGTAVYFTNKTYKEYDTAFSLLDLLEICS